MRRFIRTQKAYFIIIDDKNSHIDSLIKRLEFQTATDAYKDDLVRTLESLLIHKDELIDDLNSQIPEMKR